MLLCFVDESHRGDFYGFAGVLADEYATKALTDALTRIVSQAVIDYGLPDSTEIHGHPMFHGKEVWTDVPTRARISIFGQVIRAVVDADVTILLRAVNSDRLRERQGRENYPVNFPPEQVCFQHILQRADKVAKRNSTFALMIADERGDRERHRDKFATYQTAGTPGAYMKTNLSSLLDTVHFAPSHRSRMLQAADILAFVYRRRMTVVESDPRAQRTMDRHWRLISESGKIYDQGEWP